MDVSVEKTSKALPDVAVIMTTFNGERFVREQVESILGQTFQDFVLHVFDDRSSDRTPSIIRDIAVRDARVNFHSNSGQLGVIANISQALSSINADIYFLSDQDDIWLSEKMELQLHALQDEKTLLSFCNLELVDETGQSMGTDFWNSQEIDPSEASIPEFIAIKTMVTGCTMAFKKELLEFTLPIPTEATMHDHWLSFFAAVKGKVKPVNKMLVKYRQHSSNVIGGMADFTEIRKRRYDGCRTYKDFKNRKQASFSELLTSLLVFRKRLELHGLNHGLLDKHIDFYNSLVHHQQLKSFLLAIQMKQNRGSHSFFRTALVSAFFPLVFVYMKVFGVGE